VKDEQAIYAHWGTQEIHTKFWLESPSGSDSVGCFGLGGRMILKWISETLRNIKLSCQLSTDKSVVTSLWLIL
jgi:hypothetical protein